MIWLAVALRIVANPLSNVFQKVLTGRSADPLFVIAATHALLTLACLPLLPRFTGYPPAFWLNVSFCAALAVAANTLLVEAVRRTDLSVLGPVNAYKSVVSLLPGVVLLGEVPPAASLGGIALIVAGSYVLVGEPAAAGAPARGALGRFVRDRGVHFRFAALVLAATEAVFLKKAILAASPAATFAWWAVIGSGFSLVALARALGRRPVRGEIVVARRNAGTYLLLALTTGLMQYATLVTFAAFRVGPALALFQVSTLLTVFLGHHVFDEPHFARRLAGSLVMVAGAALIIVFR